MKINIKSNKKSKNKYKIKKNINGVEVEYEVDKKSSNPDLVKIEHRQ